MSTRADTGTRVGPRTSFGAAWCVLCLSFHQATLKPCAESARQVARESAPLAWRTWQKLPKKSPAALLTVRLVNTCGAPAEVSAQAPADAVRDRPRLVVQKIVCQPAALLPEQRLRFAPVSYGRHAHTWPRVSSAP